MNNKPTLLIIGNSNVGKSSITRLLVPNPRELKGKSGKKPGSTLLIKSINQPSMKYQIVDLPGFGYMSSASKRREEHIKREIVVYVENHHQNCFLALLVVNILRIEDEIQKYFINNQITIPLTFELITFLREYELPVVIVINKVDKLSNWDKKRKVSLLVEAAKDYNIFLSEFKDIDDLSKDNILFIEFSALKKTNYKNLVKIIKHSLIRSDFFS